jgi:hypothetical protein
MGDGRVALIMDTAAVVRYVDLQNQAGARTADGELPVAC